MTLLEPKTQARAACFDEWLGYYTLVSVQVLDPRLGCLQYLLILFVVLYVVVYQVFYLGECAKMEVPVGSVRLSFRAPTVGSCDPLHAWCQVRLRNLTELRYCTQNPRADAMQVQRCAFFDSEEAATISASRAFLATYFEAFEQERACRAEDTGCRHLWGHPRGAGSNLAGTQRRDPHARAFIADVEHFTLMLDHAVTTSTIGVTGTAREVQGFLETESPSLCATHPNRTAVPVGPGEPPKPTTVPPCYIMPNSTLPGGLGLDVFELSTLLEAAGLDLDSADRGDEGSSVRRKGCILGVEIRYSNFEPWKGTTRKVHYTYRIRSLKGHGSQVSVLASHPERRVVYDRKGIQIHVIQTGSLRAFDLLTLLITLTTALTMLTAAYFAVDSVASYILPERELFNKLKYPEVGIRDPQVHVRLKEHPAYRQCIHLNVTSPRNRSVQRSDDSEFHSEGSSTHAEDSDSS